MHRQQFHGLCLSFPSFPLLLCNLGIWQDLDVLSGVLLFIRNGYCHSQEVHIAGTHLFSHAAIFFSFSPPLSVIHAGPVVPVENCPHDDHHEDSIVQIHLHLAHFRESTESINFSPYHSLFPK